MVEFLQLCHISPDYQPVQEIITKHEIIHWTALQGQTEEVLKELGFDWGPRKLILAGLEAAQQPETQPSV